MTVELRKLSLLEWIASLSDEQIINDLYDTINYQYKNPSQFELSKSRTYSQVKMEKFDLEKVKEQQNYNGVDENKMDKLINQLDIEQSIEELLNDLD